jgi:hypothetical protein
MVLAQKDEANNNFAITLTSNTTSAITVTVLLFTNGYNQGTTCQQTCSQGVEFFAADGVTVTSQFVCWDFKLAASLILVVLALVF